MSQIIGSGAGNMNNTAVVDSSEGEMQGRLFTNGSGTSQIYDGAVGPATIDKSTHAFNIINYEHHEIHSGDHYFTCNFGNIGSGATLTIGATTAAGSKWSHLLFDWQANNQTEFRIFEGATYSGATVWTAYNNNRNSSNTSIVTDKIINPVISGASPTSGTEIWSQALGLDGATPSKASAGGFSVRGKEVILKSGTSYLFEFKSAADDNTISYCGEWYEHTEKTQQF